MDRVSEPNMGREAIRGSRVRDAILGDLKVRGRRADHIAERMLELEEALYQLLDLIWQVVNRLLDQIWQAMQELLDLIGQAATDAQQTSSSPVERSSHQIWQVA